MKKVILSIVFFVIDILFQIKLYKAKKMVEFDEKLNQHIEEVHLSESESDGGLIEEEAQVKEERRGRKKTELKAHGGKVYRVEVESGFVVEIDGVKIPKANRKPFEFYERGGVETVASETNSSKEYPLNIPADLILNFAIIPANNFAASKTLDEDKLKIGNGENLEREKAARDLSELISKYICEKTKVANPSEVILFTSAALFALPLAVSISQNPKP